MDQTLEISFEDCSDADAARFAQDLEQQLRETDPTARISFKNKRPGAQDFGATLVLVFGTPVAIALAKGVSDYLRRNAGASIRISKSGEVIARNLDSRDASRIAEAFAGKKRT